MESMKVEMDVKETTVGDVMKNREYRNWSLLQWTKMFDQIFGEKNEDASDQDVWLHVTEEIAELAEDLRKEHIMLRPNKKGEIEGVEVNVPDAFAWLCAFATKHGSLEDMVWHKYPNICPYCFVKKDCLCIARANYIDQDKREKKLEKARNDKTNMPKTLYDWQKMFWRIYGNVNRVQRMEQVGFHLMEESGEVAKEIRHMDDDKLEDEIADVFAWLVAIANKSDEIISKDLRSDDIKYFRLDDIIYKRYEDKCPKCHGNPCKEEIYRSGPRSNIR